MNAILNDRNGHAVLREAGYKRFDDSTKRDNRFYVASFQKRFDDENGKKYFVNVNVYHLSGVPGLEQQWRFDADAQFTIGDTSDSGGNYEVFNINYDGTGKTVGQIEGFYEKIWTSLGCDYYERVA